MDDETKLREFNEQLEKQHFQSLVESHPAESGESQNSIQQSTINNISHAMPSNLSPSCPLCEFCGTAHPPLQPGEKCPLAPIKSQKGEEILDLNDFFAQLKNIFSSQIDQKKIKDHKKLFQYIVIEITKILEGYKE